MNADSKSPMKGQRNGIIKLLMINDTPNERMIKARGIAIMPLSQKYDGNL